ncbi:hypothetical protein DM02DRAFT_656028 [Periconia macrospinosa]|uniref:Uncharacterized protein n=1 Tax=Periconia macrospinosa TaxID=97972 RepID=A0A2V1DR72_9PLEO|nr:hypothetical protein DM02DRAFT_656028 [Periconia macrospinosa]
MCSHTGPKVPSLHTTSATEWVRAFKDADEEVERRLDQGKLRIYELLGRIEAFKPGTPEYEATIMEVIPPIDSVISLLHGWNESCDKLFSMGDPIRVLKKAGLVNTEAEKEKARAAISANRLLYKMEEQEWIKTRVSLHDLQSDGKTDSEAGSN